MVRLEAELALEWGLHGTLDTALAGEERAAKLRLDEELSVKDARSRVEWRARDGRVDVVLSGNGVARNEVYQI